MTYQQKVEAKAHTWRQLQAARTETLDAYNSARETYPRDEYPRTDMLLGQVQHLCDLADIYLDFQDAKAWQRTTAASKLLEARHLLDLIHRYNWMWDK
jgi:hypothetical protein